MEAELANENHERGQVTQTQTLGVPNHFSTPAPRRRAGARFSTSSPCPDGSLAKTRPPSISSKQVKDALTLLMLEFEDYKKEYPLIVMMWDDREKARFELTVEQCERKVLETFNKLLGDTE